MELELTQGQTATFDDEDFELISRFKWSALKIGNSFYAVTNTSRKLGKRKVLYMHRVITGVQGREEIDHINRNGLDNRKENLRVCTHKENMQNQVKMCGSSRFKGVSWDSSNKKWASHIRVENKTKYLGEYTSESDAAIAYNEAAKNYFEEFACLNEVEA